MFCNFNIKVFYISTEAISYKAFVIKDPSEQGVVWVYESLHVSDINSKTRYFKFIAIHQDFEKYISSFGAFEMYAFHDQRIESSTTALFFFGFFIKYLINFCFWTSLNVALFTPIFLVKLCFLFHIGIVVGWHHDNPV